MKTNPPQFPCDTNGCLNPAAYFLVYGCLLEHVYNHKFCHPCAFSVRGKLKTRAYKCVFGHLIEDCIMRYIKGGDVMDLQGNICQTSDKR